MVADKTLTVVDKTLTVADKTLTVADSSCTVADNSLTVADNSCTVFDYFDKITCNIDMVCNLTRTLITQAETPLLTSLSTFCFFSNRCFKGQKNKTSFHFLLPSLY